MLFRHRNLCHAQCFQRHGLQIHAGATGAFRGAHWVSDTKEDPEQLHTLSLSMGTTFGNCCHGMRSHHTFIYMEGTQPYSHGLQNCPEKNAVEKRKINISAFLFWNVVVCIAKVFFVQYTKFNLDVPQVQFWQLENLLLYPDWACIFREGYVSFGYKILIISCLLHKCGQLSYFPQLSLDPWEKQACFYSRKVDTQ